MYSLPSRSQRRQPFAFFIAIGYGSKYFTPAVTPAGRERRARFAYPRDAFVLAARSARGSDFAMSGGHPGPDRYTLRERRGLVDLLTLNTHPPMRARPRRVCDGRWRIRKIIRDRGYAVGFRGPEWGIGPCPRRRIVARENGPRDWMRHRHERNRTCTSRISGDRGRFRRYGGTPRAGESAAGRGRNRLPCGGCDADRPPRSIRCRVRPRCLSRHSREEPPGIPEDAQTRDAERLTLAVPRRERKRADGRRPTGRERARIPLRAGAALQHSRGA